MEFEPMVQQSETTLESVLTASPWPTLVAISITVAAAALDSQKDSHFVL